MRAFSNHFSPSVLALLIVCEARAQQPNCPCFAGCQEGGVAYATDTHAALTRAALTNQLCTTHDFLSQELLIDGGLLHVTFMLGDDTPRSLVEWAEEGSVHEDDYIFWPYGRFFHHFHDPISEQGLGGTGPLPAYDAIVWAISHADNEWRLEAVADDLWTSLTLLSPHDRNSMMARTFRGVGHFMHMIEDMAQPGHTRNDPHPFDGFLEDYAQARYGTPAQLVWQGGSPPTGLAKVRWFGNGAGQPANLPYFDLINEPLPGHDRYRHFFDTDQYTGQLSFTGFMSPPGLSEYSNYGFFSEDTVFSSVYPHPSNWDTNFEQALAVMMQNAELVLSEYGVDSWIQQGLQIGYVRKHGQASIGIDTGYRLCAAVNIGPDPLVEHYDALFGGTGTASRVLLAQDDDPVLEDYCQMLLPKAIAYCTDFANFFFRGRLGTNLVGNSQTGLLELTITNLSDGTLTAGHWKLMQDDEDGYREEIEADWATYPGALAPGQSFTVTFAPPSVARSGPYTVVFKADGAPDDDFTLEVVAKTFQEPIGACCLPSNCFEIVEADCIARGGTFLEGNVCENTCPNGNYIICGACTSCAPITVE